MGFATVYVCMCVCVCVCVCVHVCACVCVRERERERERERLGRSEQSDLRIFKIFSFFPPLHLKKKTTATEIPECCGSTALIIMINLTVKEWLF